MFFIISSLKTFHYIRSAFVFALNLRKIMKRQVSLENKANLRGPVPDIGEEERCGSLCAAETPFH